MVAELTAPVPAATGAPTLEDGERAAPSAEEITPTAVDSPASDLASCQQTKKELAKQLAECGQKLDDCARTGALDAGRRHDTIPLATGGGSWIPAEQLRELQIVMNAAVEKAKLEKGSVSLSPAAKSVLRKSSASGEAASAAAQAQAIHEIAQQLQRQ